MSNWDNVKQIMQSGATVYLTIKPPYPAAWKDEIRNIAKNLGISEDSIVNANKDLLTSPFPLNNVDYTPILVQSSDYPYPGPTDPTDPPDPPTGTDFGKANNVAPLPSGTYTITQTFASGGHGGDDLAAAANTPINPIQDGVVNTVHTWDGHTTSGNSNETWGNYCIIDHGVTNGVRYYSLYAHMISSQMVSVGQSVTRTTTIGRVGKTGAATGYHLHLEVWAGGYGTSYRVNPQDYVSL